MKYIGVEWGGGWTKGLLAPQKFIFYNKRSIKNGSFQIIVFPKN